MGEKLGRLKAIKPAEAFFKYDQLPECYGKFTKTPVKVFAYQKTEEDSVLAYSRVQTKKGLRHVSIDARLTTMSLPAPIITNYNIYVLVHVRFFVVLIV